MYVDHTVALPILYLMVQQCTCVDHRIHGRSKQNLTGQVGGEWVWSNDNLKCTFSVITRMSLLKILNTIYRVLNATLKDCDFPKE